MTQLLQQSHSLNPSLIAPLTGDQAFKHMSLLGLLSQATVAMAVLSVCQQDSPSFSCPSEPVTMTIEARTGSFRERAELATRQVWEGQAWGRGRKLTHRAYCHMHEVRRALESHGLASSPASSTLGRCLRSLSLSFFLMCNG